MQQMKRINGREINILFEGQGEPLVLVHGFPLDHTMWNAQIAEFSKSNIVIAPDLRGFGASEGGGEQTSMLDFANDVAAILDELSIKEPVNLCGLSMGGYIALQFVLHHSSKLKRLILCDTKAAADSEVAKQTRLDTAAKVLQEGPDFLAETMTDKLFSEFTLDNNFPVVEQTQMVIRETSPQSIAAALRGMADRPDMTSRLPDICLPTLVLVGEHDSITISEEMRQVAAVIPAAEFVEIESAGHMAPLEQPLASNAAIEKFLTNT